MWAGLQPRISVSSRLRTSLALARDDPANVAHGLSELETRNLRLLIGIIAIVVLFRVGYEQSGNVIALWVEHQTDRSLGGLVVPATWFQAINPLLIILGTPFLIRMWDRRTRQYGKANLLRRMAVGCAIAAAAMVLMVGAAALYESTGNPVGMGWTVGYFLLLTLGELMVIPVGLSLIGSLSPSRIAAMVMGAWYIAKFLGSLFAGLIGAYWGQVPPTIFFGIGALAPALAALLLWMISPTLTSADGSSDR